MRKKVIVPAAIVALKQALTDIYWYKADLRSIRVHLRAFWPLGLISVNPEPPVMPGSPADRSQLQRTGMALSGQL